MASRVGKLFWFGLMRWLEKLMFHTPLVYIFIFASAIYHDKMWYPSHGKKVVDDWLEKKPLGQIVRRLPTRKVKRIEEN